MAHFHLPNWLVKARCTNISYKEGRNAVVLLLTQHELNTTIWRTGQV